MTRKDFKVLMDGLAIAKQQPIKDDITINIYYNKLKGLKNLTEVFNQAAIIKYNSWFPAIDDLILTSKELNKSLYKQQKEKINGKVLKGDEARKALKEVMDKEKKRRLMKEF